MSTHTCMSGFQSFLVILHLFVLATVSTSSKKGLNKSILYIGEYFSRNMLLPSGLTANLYLFQDDHIYML